MLPAAALRDMLQRFKALRKADLRDAGKDVLERPT
jgi:hypothetical protein